MPRRALVILFLAMAVAAFFGWRHYHRQADEKADHLILHGNVEIRQVDLGFRVAGRIRDMLFEEGDRVRPGEVMAELDTRPFEDELRLARAQREAEAANLARLEAGYRPEEVAQAAAQVAEREAAFQNARRVFERQQSLFGSKATSRQAFEDALAARDQAQAALRAAQEAYRLSRKGFRAEEIEAARAAVEAASARVDQAETALADATLLAPAAGTLLTRVREPGAIVAAGTIVYSLSLDEPVWVRAYVTEPNLGRVHPGQPVLIFTDSRPDRPYRGQIGFISPVAEFTPKNVETSELRVDLVYRLRVVATNPDEGLRQGMPVTVRVPLSDHPGAQPGETGLARALPKAGSQPATAGAIFGLAPALPDIGVQGAVAPGGERVQREGQSPSLWPPEASAARAWRSGLDSPRLAAPRSASRAAS